MSTILFTAKNPHYGKIKNLSDMPFIDLATNDGKVLAQLYLFRFNSLQVSHADSDSSNSAGATWSSVYFNEKVAFQLKHGDYEAALCIMELLVRDAIQNQSHRKYYNHSSKTEENKYQEMVFSALLQESDVIEEFAKMCVDAYRAHN